ncbi:MAG: 3-phosphoshikimate 1-carboxyvinyltransferase [Candidatus Omnitrophica bacterium]|nr:3-phosphoshikimate 1-carboxyvinyltransferase [Candidatus Omnitrophota bacterium]
MVRKVTLSKTCSLKGRISVPGDKSISHRAVILGSIAEGTTRIRNFLESDDCLNTIKAFQSMGLKIEKTGPSEVIVQGRGLYGLSPAPKQIYLGNSGTSMRLLLGLLSGQKFKSTLTGDESLSNRPMKRVVDPLKTMGALISGPRGNYAPLKTGGSKLSGIKYKLPVASAQVKSALLLAGLYAKGAVKVVEPIICRDHTERMLKYCGASLKEEKKKKGKEIILIPGSSLKPMDIDVPGDISSAAFFIVAGLIVPRSRVLLKNVGLNPTRTGIIDVLKRMGAHLEIKNRTRVCGEPRGDILVRSSKLKGVRISGKIIPRLIDELPIIMVAACAAQGRTVIKDAAELRVKETDRITSMAVNLKALGATLEPAVDGMIIQGSRKLKGTKVKSFGDHRTAMSLAVAGLIARGRTIIEDTECVNTSFPEFFKLLRSLSAK